MLDRASGARLDVGGWAHVSGGRGRIIRQRRNDRGEPVPDGAEEAGPGEGGRLGQKPSERGVHRLTGADRGSDVQQDIIHPNLLDLRCGRICAGNWYNLEILARILRQIARFFSLRGAFRCVVAKG